MQRTHLLSCGVKMMIRTPRPPIPAATTPMIVPIDSSIPNKPEGQKKVDSNVKCLSGKQMQCS